jgi:hypothetical protein
VKNNPDPYKVRTKQTSPLKLANLRNPTPMDVVRKEKQNEFRLRYSAEKVPEFLKTSKSRQTLVRPEASSLLRLQGAGMMMFTDMKSSKASDIPKRELTPEKLQSQNQNSFVDSNKKAERNFLSQYMMPVNQNEFRRQLNPEVNDSKSPIRITT